MAALAFTRGAYAPDLLILAEMCAGANALAPQSISLAMQAVEDCAVYGSEIVTPLDAASYVVVSENYCICIFQATTQWYQWVGHILGSTQVNAAHIPGLVNQYFNEIAQNSFANIKNVLDEQMAGKTVVCTGHSLGGATSQIVAKLIEHNYSVTPYVFTFGCPKVGNPDFSYSFAGGQVIRVEEVGDPVPALPPTMWGAKPLPLPFGGPTTIGVYRHAGTGISLSSNGIEKEYQGNPTLGAVQAFYNSQNPPSLHQINQYTTDLAHDSLDELESETVEGLDNPQNAITFLEDQQKATGQAWGIPATKLTTLFIPTITYGGAGMSIYRATFFLNMPSSGWTETFYMDAASPTDVAAKASALAKARIGLCGQGVAIENVRISDEAVKRDYGLFPLQFGSESDSTDPSGHVKGFQALVVNLIHGAYRNRLYMRGIKMSDYLGDKKVNVDSGFVSNFNNWKSRLKVDGWLMRTQKRFEPGTNYNILGATTATPSVITVQAGLAATSGDQLVVTGLKPSSMGLNSTWFCDKVDDTHFSLRGSVGEGTYLGGGVVRKRELQYISIDDCAIIKETSRKSGKNSGQSVGRRRTRKSA